MTRRLYARDDEWQDQAACQNSHPDLFFPAKYENATPVNVDCLEFALAHNMQHGIWGGTTLRERRLIKTRRLEGAA